MANMVTVKPMSDLDPAQAATVRVQVIRVDGEPVEVDLSPKEADAFLKFMERFDGKGRPIHGMSPVVYSGPQDVGEETKPEAELASVTPLRPATPARTGRRPSGRQSGAQGRRGTDPEAQAIREWAAQQGIQLSERGRIPGNVREKYQAAKGAAPATFSG